jgi:hypothetical protein
MADIYKKDIAYEHESAVGDLPTSEGQDNLRKALLRRWVTEPGTFAYRPEYGAGLLSFRNAVMNLENQRAIAKRIEEQSLKDKRVEKVSSIQFSLNETPGMQLVKVTVKPFGQSALTLILDLGV